jgi:thioredoxin reductase (NADPH)
MPKKSKYRVVILGSGPAGLTAALYASRANLEPLVVEGGGGTTHRRAGRPAHADHRRRQLPGFPRASWARDDGPLPRRPSASAPSSTRQPAEGRPLRAALRPRAGRRASHRRDAIIGHGARARWLGLPEELEFRTRIGGVSACATCDGFFYKGKEVLVVGGGDTAMEEATFLTKFAKQVTVVHRRDTLRASKIMQERAFKNPKIAWLWDSAIEKILGGAARR